MKTSIDKVISWADISEFSHHSSQLALPFFSNTIFFREEFLVFWPQEFLHKIDKKALLPL